ncbi:MAG TPA: biotin synthase BioB [Rhodospirillales bacterium]|nr:biotin synthase BioB [Rhodospirillales bacterium]
MPLDTETAVRHDWTMGKAEALFQRPFNDLLFDAQTLHRRYFDANQVQMSRLISIKSGGCPEDCAYCPQSAGHDTDVKAEKLMQVDHVVAAARNARDGGATRYCMGAAWRNPKESDLDHVCAMIEGVRALGLETCATLGMLSGPQARKLKQAGLDYYNHNLDTSEEFYGEIITTRTYQDRLDTLENVRQAGINVCCGGIVGLGESRHDRAGLLVRLANMTPHPESVPINMLVRVEGTPLETFPDLDGIEFVRTVAAAKIMMPASVIRLSAGRQDMTDEMQALCFLAGAGSIFVGDKLLTTANPDGDADDKLFERLGLSPAPAEGKPA